MGFAVLIDFGSTYTKMVCVDIDEGKVISTDKYPSTVHTDAGIGLNQCFDAAKKLIGGKNFRSALKLATSSAAGGLRMSVVGLTKSLSIEAGRNASFSAGAKIVSSTAGLISEKDLEEIENSKAEILLLCGGYEKGNTHGIIHNARVLSKSKLNIPIIYAGNSSVAHDIRRIFIDGKKECFLTENIIPNLNVLNTGPTTEIIRQLFMDRITNMKGVGSVQNKLDGPIVPTPASILSAGELLSLGTKNKSGMGDIVIADIGGATTDIYSYIQNKNFAGAKLIGSPEPFAKRTVEGDIGMRESSICLVNEVGEAKFAKECGVSQEFIKNAIEKRTTTTSYIADDYKEKIIDHNIAEYAVNIATRRHVGYVAKEFNSGCNLVQRGKNLTEIKTIVGTGGVIVNEEDAISILENIKISESEKERVLLPENVNALVDYDYVLFAAGLLRGYDEELAFDIIEKSLKLS